MAREKDEQLDDTSSEDEDSYSPPKVNVMSCYPCFEGVTSSIICLPFITFRQFCFGPYFLFHHSFFLRKQVRTKAKLSLSDAIDLTGAKSVARQTHDSLSVQNKEAANQQSAKTLKTKINKETKDILLDVAHREKLDLLNCEHLTKSVVPVSTMIHPLKLTMEQLMNTQHALKVASTLVFIFCNEFDLIYHPHCIRSAIGWRWIVSTPLERAQMAVRGTSVRSHPMIMDGSHAR
jgi:hypothetical protein